MRLLLLDQIRVLVRRLPHPGDPQARHRPQPATTRQRLRDPRPHPRPRDPPRSDVRVPPLHPTRKALPGRPHRAPTTTTPTPKADPNPAPRRPRTSPRCAPSTTDSRPTPAGATPWSNPVSSSGPAPTATATSGTTRAPRHSGHLVSRQDFVLPQPARRSVLPQPASAPSFLNQRDHDIDLAPTPRRSTTRRGNRHVGTLLRDHIRAFRLGQRAEPTPSALRKRAPAVVRGPDDGVEGETAPLSRLVELAGDRRSRQVTEQQGSDKLRARRTRSADRGRRSRGDGPR